MRIIPLACLGAALLASGCCMELCDVYRGRGVRVEGVRLKHKRTVEITAELERRFAVAAHAGDIEIRGIQGREARLRVELHEYRPDDGELHLTDRGELVADSHSGRPAAIGELVAELPHDLALEIETGMGEIHIQGMRGSPGMEVSTGMGDVDLEDLHDVLLVEASSGMGDVSLCESLGLGRAALSTGMGGIVLEDAAVERIEVSSGMGSIYFRDCELGFVAGSTGMGSIHFKDTVYEDSKVSTGMGGIKYD